MYEYRANHHRCGRYPDDRPPRPVPRVDDPHPRAFGGRVELPLDFHSLRDTPDMAESDRWRRPIDRHQREPPRRPVDDRDPARAEIERSVRRHLDQASPIRFALPEPDVAVMR